MQCHLIKIIVKTKLEKKCITEPNKVKKFSKISIIKPTKTIKILKSYIIIWAIIIWQSFEWNLLKKHKILGKFVYVNDIVHKLINKFVWFVLLTIFFSRNL